MAAPAMLFVGETVACARTLAWFDGEGDEGLDRFAEMPVARARAT
jgi:hypothetical protein